MTAQLRFLFDECLSPDLVSIANSRDLISTHVKFLDRLGASDRRLAVVAFETDAVFVTNNGRDFKRIYRELSLQPGLVVILPSIRVEVQTDLFLRAVGVILTIWNFINTLVEVSADGSVRVSDWSRDLPSIQ